MVHGRAYAVTATTPPMPYLQQPDASVVRGTFLIFNSWARVLIDLGASHSFIASSFVRILGLETNRLSSPLVVDTPVGGKITLDQICRECDLVILDRHFVFDFILLDMSGYDLILGMDWLFTFHATIDCHRRRVRVCAFEGDCFDFYREHREVVVIFV